MRNRSSRCLNALTRPDSSSGAATAGRTVGPAPAGQQMLGLPSARPCAGCHRHSLSAQPPAHSLSAQPLSTALRGLPPPQPLSTATRPWSLSAQPLSAVLCRCGWVWAPACLPSSSVRGHELRERSAHRRVVGCAAVQRPWKPEGRPWLTCGAVIALLHRTRGIHGRGRAAGNHAAAPAK